MSLRMTNFTAHPTAHCLLLAVLPSRFAFAAVAATAATIAAAAIAAATAAATVTTTSATAATAILARSGFIDVQGAPVDFLAVELSNGRFSFFFGSHFDKAKAA